jgi:hypothetical protein
MRVTDETKQLAREILAYWNKYNHHDQGSWIEDDEITITTGTLMGKEVKVCDTAMCAAGTAVFLRTTDKEFKTIVREHFSDDVMWEERGGELLGLEYDEARSMFYSSNDTAKQLMKAIAKGDKARFDEIVDYHYEGI